MNALTWADIFFQFFDMVAQMGVTLDKYPLLKSLSERVANLPNIKKWVKDRPANSNSAYAPWVMDFEYDKIAQLVHFAPLIVYFAIFF